MNFPCSEVSKRSVLLSYFLLVLLVLAILCQTMPASAGTAAWVEMWANELAEAQTIPAGQPFTVAAEVTFPDFDLNRTQGVVLIGLAAADDPQEMVLAVAGALVTKGFWPTWQLQMISTEGILPGNLPGGGDTGLWPASESVELKQYVSFVAGRDYEIKLSCDPVIGAVSLQVIEKATNTVIHSGGYRLPAFSRALKPVVGIYYDDQNILAVGRPAAPAAPAAPATAPTDSPSIISSLDIVSDYIPLGMQMSTCAKGLFEDCLHMVRFGRSENIFLKFDVPGAQPQGSFRIRLDSRLAEKELAVLTAAEETNWLTLPTEELPLGSSKLVAEYLSAGGEVLYSIESDIVIGNLTAAFDAVHLNRADSSVYGTINLYADDHLPGLSINMETMLVELVWDKTSRDYIEKLYPDVVATELELDLPPGGYQLPFDIPMPEKEGLWKVVFQIEVFPDIGLVTANESQIFQNYSPPSWQPGEPYTIAVFPDTQYFSERYPHIFTRMVEWVAQNAAERNIELLLHMGDITDDNSPDQWKRAQTSLKLLNGFIPYALAVGNHDMATGGGNVSRRGLTLLNNYFSKSDFSGLAGTFAENRLENSYHLFEIGGTEYLVVSLEFCPPEEVVAWANEVIAQHPTRKVILITHSYTTKDGYPAAAGASASSYNLGSNPDTTMVEGVDMWRKLVKNHENFFMVLSGHRYSPTIPRRIAHGDAGNKVYEFLVDFQSEPNGGDGWFVLMEFRPDGNIYVDTYSPYLDEYKRTVDRYGYNCHFLIDTERGAFIVP